MLPKEFLLVLLLIGTIYGDENETSLRFPVAAPNKVVDVSTACNGTALEITIVMDRPYKGMISAKDFSQECGVLGSLRNVLRLTLPASGCGVRLSVNSNDSRLYYSINLIVQQDKLLRQFTDQEIVVRCYLQEQALAFQSEPMFQALRNEVGHENAKDNRTGRMRSGWKEKIKNEKVEISDEVDNEIQKALTSARVWMEIGPAEHKNPVGEFVQVGQPTLLAIKSTLPAGIGWRVVECNAHDGTGDLSQKLLDEDGCAVDETILPELTMMAAKILGSNKGGVAVMRHQEAVTSFPAFKFPDRDRLHVSCGLQLCRGRCIDPDCRGRKNNGSRGSRRLQKGDRGEVLDRLEVFNSVEVLAPGIELDSSDVINDGKTSSSTTLTSIPGDRTFCVSPNRMALAFCVLGIIFLIAVLVALWSLMRARRSGVTVPYYTRSLFSSSSGSGSGSRYGGSKLLLNESPCLGQTRHWRVL